MHRHTDRPSAIVTITIVALLAMSVSISTAYAQDAVPEDSVNPLGIDWVFGPATGELGPFATIDVPEGYIFAGPDDTRKLMLAMENPVNGTEMGFIAEEDADWFVVFEYDDVGYISDDERDSLDAEAMMESMREGQKAGNEERRRLGWDTLELVGWLQPPHYDAESNNLEWGTKLRSSGGGENVNYNSRLLGRGGVMSATLVGDEATLGQVMPAYRTLLTRHEFAPGQRYAEFRQGDKVAAYGLAALVTGGAAAVALKSGLLQKFWKLIVAGLVALGAGLKRLFGRSGERIEPPEGSASA